MHRGGVAVFDFHLCFTFSSGRYGRGRFTQVHPKPSTPVRPGGESELARAEQGSKPRHMHEGGIAVVNVHLDSSTCGESKFYLRICSRGHSYCHGCSRHKSVFAIDDVHMCASFCGYSNFHVCTCSCGDSYCHGWFSFQRNCQNRGGPPSRDLSSPTLCREGRPELHGTRGDGTVCDQSLGSSRPTYPHVRRHRRCWCYAANLSTRALGYRRLHPAERRSSWQRATRGF